MLSAGGVIVSCIAANTAVNLLYPLSRVWERICYWWRRIGRKSVFINRDSAYELFKNIARDISPLVTHKKSMILSFIEDNGENNGENNGKEKQTIITRVPFPDESVFKKFDKNFVIEIISLGDRDYVHGFEILYDERRSPDFRNFLATLPTAKKLA